MPVPRVLALLVEHGTLASVRGNHIADGQLCGVSVCEHGKAVLRLNALTAKLDTEADLGWRVGRQRVLDAYHPVLFPGF